jgi:hypothetical protein
MMLPVSTDWRIPAEASAAMASAAPGNGRTGPGTAPSAATRASATRKASTSPRGIPASASVSPAMARSVRPAFGATSVSSRPNISRNTTSYRRVPRPSAPTSV